MYALNQHIDEMKTRLILTTLSLFIIDLANGQETEHLFYLTVSNNGQLEEVIDDFYFEPDSYNPSDDVFSFDQTIMKFNFHYEFKTKKDLIFSSTFGYGYRRDRYVVGNQPGIPPDGEEYQTYLSGAIGIRYAWSIEKVQVSTGLELPLYIFSDCVKTYQQDDPNQTIHYTETTTGGKAFGINSTTSLKWFVLPNFFISSNLSFGLLKFDVGHETITNNEVQDPIFTSEPIWVRENSYRKTTITRPEFLFGLGARL